MVPVARERTMPLPDGRRLAWSSGGDDDGVPVLYLHGAIGTPVRRTAELDLLIAELGIRYLAVSRPGFGRSDPCPGRRIADFPADVEHLADRLGLGRFTVVGVSAGGPYAIACARALHDRVVATAAVSSLSPLGAPHAGRWMPAHIRLGLRALARRPDLAARGGTRVVRLLERHPHALARVAAMGATPADRRLLADGEMGETAIESFLAAASGGVQGMIEDYVTCCTAWGLRPAGGTRRGPPVARRARPLRARRTRPGAGRGPPALPRAVRRRGRPLLLPPPRGRGAGRAGRGRSAAEGLRRRGHDLLLRHVAQALGEVPSVPEGIGELAVALAPEGLAQVVPDRGARLHRARPGRVDVLDVEL
jgi:pimeloyl-ACP methyl ester carboxylesterase